MADLTELREKLELMELVDYRKTDQKVYDFKPHPKQLAHLALGGRCRERLLIAGNRCGKTETGAFEAVCHMTGE